MKRKCLHTAVTVLCVLLGTAATAKDIVVTSPSGRLTATLTQGAQTSLVVAQDGREVMTFADLGFTANGQTQGKGAPGKVRLRKGDETLRPVVPLKQAEIRNRYTEAAIAMKDGASLIVRVMDNAVAYRWQLPAKVAKVKRVLVDSEQLTLRPADELTAHLQPCGSFNTSYEEAYQHKSIEQWQQDATLATLPALFSATDGSDLQVLVGEADVIGYPHLFLRGTADGIRADFPRYPEVWEPRGDRGEKITKEADYIATLDLQRSTPSAQLPWRFAVVTDSKGIIEQTVPVQLARRTVLDDTSWIRPGKVSWEWWNGAAPYGTDVDFKTGCNYETYCYYADFAARFGIEYILLDEGWAASTRDPYHGNADLRLPDLIKYCNQRGVKVILWLPWLTVQQQDLATLFRTYAEWGIPAVKIDFMDHADQWMNDFYRRVAAEAAKHKILVDFHGSFSPAGLEQEYPNLISYEGVRGLEQMGGCRPENTTFIPFMRNAVGPADFTPGGFNNMQPDRYRAERPNSGAMGTRVFQMALYVVLESGVQMLADNPTLYYRNEDCTRYISSVPVTWDETRCLAAKAGEYVVVAKRKGKKWFVGGITNNDERTLKLSLDFLGAGEHRLTAFVDGVNAGWQAMHYNKVEQAVTPATTIEVKMARNGGYAAVIE